MKLRIAYILVVLLVAGAAGIAWASQGAATPSPAQTPEVGSPAEDGGIVAPELDELFIDPTDLGACCFAECYEQRSECLAGCPPISDPGWEACINNCGQQFNDCRANC
jgi:hypothetical protein